MSPAIKSDLKKFIKELPIPLNKEKYYLLKRGIWDNPNTNVYINFKKDFTFLFPQEKLDYTKYTPRKQKIGLNKYKRSLLDDENKRRYQKIFKYFDSCENYLEIGSGEGYFLELLNTKLNLQLSSLEKDEKSNLKYKKYKWLNRYKSFSEITNKFDIICFFHVFEHIYKPDFFLKKLKTITHKKSKIILEVPSLNDPILNIYKIKEFKDFFFQTQHPFTYSESSLVRILRRYFIIEKKIPFQRYGIENHLSWLTNKKPGGNKKLSYLFQSTNENYIKDLEKSKSTDSSIIVLKNK